MNQYNSRLIKVCEIPTWHEKNMIIQPNKHRIDREIILNNDDEPSWPENYHPSSGLLDEDKDMPRSLELDNKNNIAIDL